MAASEDSKVGDINDINDIETKHAASTLLSLFNNGAFAPDGDSSDNNNGTGNNFTIKTVLIPTTDDETKEQSLEAQAAIETLASKPGIEQYNLIRQQVESAFGSTFELESKVQEEASNALLKGIDYEPTKLISSIETHKHTICTYADSNKSNFMEIDEKSMTRSIVTSAKADNDRVVTYVKGELEQLIKEKNDNSKTVSSRGVGANRAFTGIGDSGSDVDVSKQLNLSKQGYRLVDLSINTDLLTDDAAARAKSENLVLIEAGAYVGDVCDYYWPIDKYDSLINEETGKPYKVLPNRGGYKLLSIVGLSSVGAMGFSGYNGKECNVGAIQSAIVSIELLAVQDGKVVQYQIEPKTNGIHKSDDETKNTLLKNGIILRQDDQLFSDVVTSMGCFGVITRVYINLDDAYYLKEQREKVILKNWEKKFEEIIKDPSIYVWEAWFNPYQVNELITPASMVVTYWSKVEKGTKPSNQKDIKKHAGVERGSMSLSSMKTSGYALQALASSGLWEGVAAGLDIGLNQTLFSKGYDSFVMSFVQALDFGTPNGMPTQTSGHSFKLEEIKNVVNKYIEFLNDQGKNDKKLLITSPFALRFSKKSYGSVSCAGEYDVAWIEQPILTVGKGNWATNQGYKTALKNANRLLERSRKWFQSEVKYQSKIHWGLYFDENDAMPEEYPWFQYISKDNKNSFFENYKTFNKDGFFRNGFTQRSGMDQYAGFS